MQTLYVFLLLCFLVWVFFLSTSAHALRRLGETLSFGIAKGHPARFFYLPFHTALFKKRSFELWIFSATLGGNLARLGYAVVSLLFLTDLFILSWPALLIGSLVLLFLLLLVGDFLPRFWVMRSPESALDFSAGITSFFLYLSLPFSLLFLLGMREESKKEEVGPLEEMKETIVTILQSANVQGKLDASDKKLIESVIKFKDRIVREVMVPRVDLFTLPVTTSIREASKLLVEEGYSRIPVFRENIDNIIGVLMFKDVFELYMEIEAHKKESSHLDASIETIAKSVFYTPETKKVSHLLQEFRTKQMHLAIVVDEYGGTEGVVTIEDILEEIVGEISDEYDIDEEMLYIAQPGGGSWIVDARMSIFDAEDTFGIHIPQEGEYDTIGGYIFHKVGAIPQKGLRIHHEDFDLEILSSTERSVEKVRITPRRSEKKE